MRTGAGTSRKIRRGRRGPGVWFAPTWNGDFRLVPHKDDPSKTVMSIVDPTPLEKTAIVAIGGILVDRGWLVRSITDELAGEVVVDAPLEKVGPVVMAALRPGPAVLTCVKRENGAVEVCEHHVVGAGSTTEKELVKLASKPAEAAVTVKRPTPCCPDCFVEAVKPATETLLAFLTPEQHATWKRDRYVIAKGGLTGHRYIIAHRSSEIAAKNGRIAWDCDDMDTMHFHDQSVPPEEEVLSAMLCLQHREPWLRNEATCLGHRFTKVYKNPFGDHLDGVADAQLTRMVGILAIATRDRAVSH